MAKRTTRIVVETRRTVVVRGRGLLCPACGERLTAAAEGAGGRPEARRAEAAGGREPLSRLGSETDEAGGD
jgi:hypothetical protein